MRGLFLLSLLVSSLVSVALAQTQSGGVSVVAAQPAKSRADRLAAERQAAENRELMKALPMGLVDEGPQPKKNQPQPCPKNCIKDEAAENKAMMEALPFAGLSEEETVRALSEPMEEAKAASAAMGSQVPAMPEYHNMSPGKAAEVWHQTFMATVYGNLMNLDMIEKALVNAAEMVQTHPAKKAFVMDQVRSVSEFIQNFYSSSYEKIQPLFREFLNQGPNAFLKNHVPVVGKK
jgi:hypothetical protein